MQFRLTASGKYFDVKMGDRTGSAALTTLRTPKVKFVYLVLLKLSVINFSYVSLLLFSFSLALARVWCLVGVPFTISPSCLLVEFFFTFHTLKFFHPSFGWVRTSLSVAAS